MTVEPPALLEPAGALLVVHAHPDDETLATGGLLATWAASGQDVTLVTCTRGERGEVIGEELAHLEGDGAALAAHREGELERALEALGVREHVFLDQLPLPGSVPVLQTAVRYEDSGMAWVGGGSGGSGQAGAAAAVPAGALVAGQVEEQAARLAELVRMRRPEVVVTYEPGGGYGHPDHVRAHEITMRAVALAAEPSAASPAHVPDVWWAVVPPGVLRHARAALAQAVGSGLLDVGGAQLPDPHGPLPAVAGGGYVPEIVVDTSPFLDRLEASLRSHATQVHLVGRLGGALDVPDVAPDEEPADPSRPELVGTYALSNDILVPWIAAEFYARAGARPTSRSAQPAPSVER